MLKHILIIIKNELKSNVALWLELAVVAIFLWFIVDTVYVTLYNYFKPLGFETEHTYRMYLGYLEEGSPMYSEPASKEEEGENIRTIIRRLETNPKIESVSVSLNSSPHIGSNSFSSLFNDTICTERSHLRRMMTPSFFEVFKYKSVNGSTEELVKAFEEAKFVLSESVAKELFGSPEKAVGKLVSLEKDPNEGNSVIVGAVSTDIRYDNFWNYDLYFGIPLTPDYFPYFGGKRVRDLEFCFRVKPEEDHDFLTYFWEEVTGQLQIGNYFVQRVSSIPADKENFQIANMNNVKTKGLLVLFLLVNIFLGVMGVFWFRTQARRQQIGLRIALGDTPRGVLGKFYAEGLIILVTAMIPSLIVMYLLGQKEMLSIEYMEVTLQRYLIGLAITFALLCVMIIVGIWLPSRKAINMSPAVALAEE